MPVRTERWPAGAPSWVDIGVPDTAAAKQFYGSLFGWAFEGSDDPNSEFGGYLMCRVGDSDAAGLGPQQDPNDPPKWMTSFATDDADQTAKLITEHGGTVLVEPFDVGPMGRMAVALDPLGQPFALWQAGQHPGTTVVDEAGALCWTEGWSTDLDATRTFYGGVLDLTFEPAEELPGYWLFKRGDQLLGGVGKVDPQEPWTAPGWLSYFGVTDTDAAVETVRAAGGEILLEPTDSPHGRMAVVRDPWGARLAVISVPDEPTAT